jgi:hypothetical protein
MAITTVGEAHAVNDLARLLLPDDKPGDADKARDALALLAKASQAKLKAGITAKEVTGQWGRHLIIARIAAALYGDDTPALIRDLANSRQLAVSFLNRPWFDAHIERELTDEEWALLVPKLARYDDEVEDSWLNERFADDLLREAGIEKHIPDLSNELADDMTDDAADDAAGGEDDGHSEGEDQGDSEGDDGAAEEGGSDEPPAGPEPAPEHEPEPDPAPETEAAHEETEDVDPPAPEDEVDAPPADEADIDPAA